MRPLKSLGLSLLILLLASLSAGAQESAWKRTFAPQAIGSYLPKGKNDVIVVAAGAQPTDASAVDLASAAKALANAFRLCGMADLVMDSASLGPLARLEDSQIVKRAAAMPINRVAILRLFPAGPGEPFRAVVTIYDKTGAVVGAFSGSEGASIERSEASVEGKATEGTNARAADEVAAQVSTYRADNKKAQETYERFFIGFDDWAAVTQTGGVVRTWTQPWQGKYKKPLEGADFYRAIGRQDLAERYAAKGRTKGAICVIGVAVTALGIYIASSSVSMNTPNYSSDNPSDWQSKDDSGRLVWGMVIAGVGSMMITLPWLASSHPVDAPEARRLADLHNMKLKAKLGLSADEDDSGERRPRRASGSILATPLPFASPGGGGLRLVGSF
jgi:hypothetical protein